MVLGKALGIVFWLTATHQVKKAEDTYPTDTTGVVTHIQRLSEC